VEGRKIDRYLYWRSGVQKDDYRLEGSRLNDLNPPKKRDESEVS
jgi:hypothetical protein